MIPRISERVAQAHRTGWEVTDRPDSDVSIGGGLKNISIQNWDANWKNPNQIIRCPALVNNSHEKVDHPTQKPVRLLKYLIKTYTDVGDTVLDFTMGSGSTGVACQELGRNFIGIELEEKYYDIAVKRMESYQSNLDFERWRK